MRNIALAIVVLAFTATAMGEVTITIENDTNVVTLGYDCNEGELVRAFALDIDVNSGAFVVSSPVSSVDPNLADYYIYPGSISFTVVDGNTVIDVPNFGTPIAEQDANGGVLEMASLYSANDPDPNRHDPPAASGDLVDFGIDCGNSYTVAIDLSENGKRGGVVLEDPNEAFTLNLPGTYVIDCNCFTCPGQPYGDCTGDGNINIFDWFAFQNAYGTGSATHNHGTAKDEYNCCADNNADGSVNIFDWFTFQNYYGTSGYGGCLDTYCPP